MFREIYDGDIDMDDYKFEIGHEDGEPKSRGYKGNWYCFIYKWDKTVRKDSMKCFNEWNMVGDKNYGHTPNQALREAIWWLRMHKTKTIKEKKNG